MMSVDLDNLGAWMVKCNPALFDIEVARDGGHRIPDWTVVPSYRTRLMAAGQRILLWVTGTAGARPTPGLWGIGVVTGRTFTRSPGDDPGLWRDETERRRHHTFVPLDLTLFDAPIDRNMLRYDPALTNLEVLIQPQIANPLRVTHNEYTRLEQYFPVVPAVDDSARAVVARTYRDLGWTVEDVHARQPGWDLTCTGPGGHVIHLATRTAVNNRPTALLTQADADAAARDPNWRLATVRQPWTRPSITEVDADTALGRAQPYLYEVDLRAH
ncbi:EVE domain-containing protein [Micromonospora sp. CPCC 205371]|nr:EVE domain-containing protein [Micromonospora sp. CPCC 205371]